jgi:hypothetical protein
MVNNKGFFWLIEIFVGFFLILLFIVLFVNYSSNPNLNYYYAIQKSNDVLRVTSYLHNPLTQETLDSFFENFGYSYCIGSSCISNGLEYSNKISNSAKVLFSELKEKEVSITVFYK